MLDVFILCFVIICYICNAITKVNLSAPIDHNSIVLTFVLDMVESSDLVSVETFKRNNVTTL